MLRGIFQPKPLQAILASAENPESSLKRSLGAFQLTLLGIGAVIGAGIFSTVGTAAAGGAEHPGAGPAIVLSFILTVFLAIFLVFLLRQPTVNIPSTALTLWLLDQHDS